MYRFGAILLLVGSIGTIPLKPEFLHPDAGLDIIELVQKYGYPIESHQVQTEDGYLLTLHRIPRGLNNTLETTRPPVLLMHGLLSSSVDWVNMGPGTALGLLLADNGYDVWLGNQRGSTWSRKHQTLDPDTDAEKFFNFSFHEIGYFDIPAKIDYILDTTGQEKIFYVGHSQGTTVFFVMASERPEYNAKIRLMSALAPIAYMGHLPNPLIFQVAEHYDVINTLVEILHIHEFLPHYDFITELGETFCSNSSDYRDACYWILNIIAGFDSEVDPDFIPVITSNAPAGSCIKQFLHYFQEIKSSNFSQYDYGEDENDAHYGQKTPPLYDTSKITAPVSLHYASNDWLAALEDVERLKNELPNLVNAKLVPFDHFNHLDFLWARHVVPYLNNDVIEEIKSN
ncbi:lipase 3-like [Tribolium madens]|uniref:lipase 3-like n=1 Tax=Tribolium madens TaxID=41895 RepID=UPI001CF757D9|nr:lipase 3-like [Tribolium madens]